MSFVICTDFELTVQLIVHISDRASIEIHIVRTQVTSSMFTVQTFAVAVHVWRGHGVEVGVM